MSATGPASAPARTTEGCRFCWMCRQACPVGHVTARETFTPHAWALLIESVARGQMSWNRETADVMYACADCGLCQAHCATDQPLPDAINASRVALASAGLAPEAVYELDKQLRANAAASRAVATHAGRAVLFVGDAGRTSPPTVAAASRLLAAAGRVVTPMADGRSSGLLASTLGLRDTAISLAKQVVAEIAESGATEVVVLSPADRWTFEHVYPTRLGVAWPEGVSVREAVSVLAEACAAGTLRIRQTAGQPYAYHDPCHAPRLGHDRPEPRALLAAALGATGARQLFFREHRAHPCGAVGGLEITNRALAARLAQSRVDDARRAGAEWLVTDDPMCLQQLTAQAMGQIAVKSLYAILADAL